MGTWVRRASTFIVAWQTASLQAQTPTPTPADFTLVALPDTQYYVSSLNGGLPAMFTSQTNWIVANRSSRNIAYVAQLGDCTQNGDNSGNNAEWLIATDSLYRLENPNTTFLPNGIPYGVAVGNHDQFPNGSATGTTTFYNQYFGEAHFLPSNYYGGHYSTNNDNHYDLFSASGMDFIVVYFEFDTAMTTGSPVLLWANNLLQTYSNRRAIVVSHWIINSGFNASFSAQGQAIYTVLKSNPNLFLMLCGHVTPPEGQRTDTINGRTVWTVLSDYQGRTGGGNGWLRLYEFSPSNNIIHVKTFSPWLSQFETDADSQFDIPYAMTATPTPTPTPTPEPSATPTPVPTPTASPTSTPEASATPALISISGEISYCASSDPVTNVAVNMSGDLTGSTQSDVSGAYDLADLPANGNYILTPTMSALPPGSSAINTIDVVATQRHFLGVAFIPPGCPLTAADVNSDAAINTIDVVAIQRFFLGVTTGTANTGHYFFSPANRSYSGIVNSQTDQNFSAFIIGDVNGL